MAYGLNLSAVRKAGSVPECGCRAQPLIHKPGGAGSGFEQLWPEFAVSAWYRSAFI